MTTRDQVRASLESPDSPWMAWLRRCGNGSSA